MGIAVVCASSISGRRYCRVTGSNTKIEQDVRPEAMIRYHCSG